MLSFNDVRDIRGWFSEPSAEGDVVLASRVRLAGNLLMHPFPASLAPRKAVVLSEDTALHAVVNGEDHLRIACVREGLSLKGAHRRADELDSALEDELHFAASMEWGYLTSSAGDLGTGLR